MITFQTVNPMRKKMKPDIWMPLFPGDYLRDTMHLDAEGHGAYLLLIMAYWSNGGPIPANEEWLKNVCRVKDQSWMRVRGLVMPFFKPEGEKLRHKRIDDELQNATETTEARRRAGLAGNAARWGIANASQTDRNAMAIGLHHSRDHHDDDGLSGASESISGQIQTQNTPKIANASQTHRIGIANASQTNPPSPSPSPSKEEGSQRRSLSFSPADFAERPDWPEFWAYCQQVGLGAEWFAKDKFLAAESDGWKNKDKWKAYVTRCKAWWEQDGRPMKPPVKKGVVEQRENPLLKQIRNLAKLPKE